LEFPLSFSVRQPLATFYYWNVLVVKGKAEVVRKAEQSFVVGAVVTPQVIKEQAPNSTGFAPMRKVKILVTPLFETWIVVWIVFGTYISKDSVKVNCIFLE
jgi:tryptophan synthase alpha subunit